MALLIFRCGGCGAAIRTVNRPQYWRDQEVITPLECDSCKDKQTESIEVPDRTGKEHQLIAD